MAAAPAATAAMESAKTVVLDFYRQAMEQKDPRGAYSRYAAPGFIEHSDNSKGGTAAASEAFLKTLIARSPDPKWEVVRSAAEGDLVFLHVKFTAGPKTAPIAIVEIFRVANGKLTEHWDVVGPPPLAPVNPNSRF
jgi:predicted SnoaL-like aldol condensation-catalyzing enzyme